MARVPGDVKRVVIDNGGHTCKVGFAGQTEPVKCMMNGMVKAKQFGKVFVAVRRRSHLFAQRSRARRAARRFALGRAGLHVP